MTDHVIKLMTLGDAGGGKTTLISRLCNQIHNTSYQPTIGVEFNVLYLDRGGKSLKLQLWDTAGQECYAPIVRSYYKNMAGAFYVIDLTSNKAIKRINYWLREFNKNINCESHMIVIGNKCDSPKRVISKDVMVEKFREKNITYIELSAINTIDINVVMFRMVDYIVLNYDLENHPGVTDGLTHGSIRDNKLVVKNRDAYTKNRGCCILC